MGMPFNRAPHLAQFRERRAIDAAQIATKARRRIA
jgi:hypothetical protein